MGINKSHQYVMRTRRDEAQQPKRGENQPGRGTQTRAVVVLIQSRRARAYSENETTWNRIEVCELARRSEYEAGEEDNEEDNEEEEGEEEEEGNRT